MILDECSTPASWLEFKLELLAWRDPRRSFWAVLSCGEEEEGRCVAEGERRGDGCQGEGGAGQCLHHDGAMEELVVLG